MFQRHVLGPVVTIVWLVSAIHGMAEAAPTPAERCAAAKTKAAGKNTYDKAKCHNRAILAERAVDELCLARAETKFVATFAKADATGGCVVIGDAAKVETNVDDCIATVIAAVSGAAGCTATKVRAAGRTLYDETRCHQRAMLNGAGLDSACFARAETKFASAIATADLAGVCTGTAGELETAVDACVGTLVEPTTVTTTSTVATTTTSTTLPATYCCQAVASIVGIDIGLPPVACLDHVSGDSLCSDMNARLTNDPVNGVVGLAFDMLGVCDGASGACADSRSASGNCCQLEAPDLSGTCLESSDLTAEICAALGREQPGILYTGSACLPGTVGSGNFCSP